jgi:hypothetical protein
MTRADYEKIENMKPRHAAALALVGWYLLAPTCCIAEPFVADRCGQHVNVRQILDIAMATARGYGYKTDAMFMEFEGPMHWHTFMNSNSRAADLHPSQIKQWKNELVDRCLWSIYFGCEPGHPTSDGGFEGCIDYPPELWLLIDSGSGKTLHTFRYTGTSARPRIDQ